MRRARRLVRLERHTYSAHTAALGFARGASVYLASRVWPKAGGRRVTAMAPGIDVPLTVRSGGSDLLVFKGIFITREYDWNFSAAPRVIVDAGGYIGLSAAFFAARYPEATIIAIEPDADNFELLQMNTAHFPNVHAVHAAVWHESGRISLRDPGWGSWGFQVTDAGSQDGQPADLIRAVTIPEIIEEFGLDRIDLLKIDVEGSEKEIFSASAAWISAVDVICIELHDRFKDGCSSAFFQAVGGAFPIELRRGEDVLVARAESRLAPVS
jgi:FkbM family methyltransferase